MRQSKSSIVLMTLALTACGTTNQTTVNNQQDEPELTQSTNRDSVPTGKLIPFTKVPVETTPFTTSGGLGMNASVFPDKRPNRSSEAPSFVVPWVGTVLKACEVEKCPLPLYGGLASIGRKFDIDTSGGKETPLPFREVKELTVEGPDTGMSLDVQSNGYIAYAFSDSNSEHRSKSHIYYGVGKVDDGWRLSWYGLQRGFKGGYNPQLSMMESINAILLSYRNEGPGAPVQYVIGFRPSISGLNWSEPKSIEEDVESTSGFSMSANDYGRVAKVIYNPQDRVFTLTMGDADTVNNVINFDQQTAVNFKSTLTKGQDLFNDVGVAVTNRDYIIVANTAYSMQTLFQSVDSRIELRVFRYTDGALKQSDHTYVKWDSGDNDFRLRSLDISTNGKFVFLNTNLEQGRNLSMQDGFTHTEIMQFENATCPLPLGQWRNQCDYQNASFDCKTLQTQCNGKALSFTFDGENSDCKQLGFDLGGGPIKCLER